MAARGIDFPGLAYVVNVTFPDTVSVFFLHGQFHLCCSVLQCVAGCCSVLQSVAECCRVLQCVAVCCSVLQCAAVCCSALQCVAV